MLCWALRVLVIWVFFGYCLGCCGGVKLWCGLMFLFD